MLKVDWWLVRHVYLLVKVEEVVAAEILADGEKEAFVCREVAAAGKGVGFAAERESVSMASDGASEPTG
jgi:hypothetical protein